MATYKILYWQEIPSQVRAEDDTTDVSVELPQKFMVRIDAMAAEVDHELDRIVAAANKAGKIMGAYCHSAERAVALAKRGVRFLAVGSDMGFLRAGAAAALKGLAR